MEITKKAYSDSDRVLDFIRGSARTIASDKAKFSYVDSVGLLEDMFRIERENYDLEVRMRMGDGALIFYQGVARALIIQAQRHVRLLLWKREDTFETEVKFLLEGRSDRGVSAHRDGYSQWKLSKEGVTRFLQYLDILSKPQKGPQDSKKGILTHPRYFTAQDRRTAYAEF